MTVWPRGAARRAGRVAGHAGAPCDGRAGGRGAARPRAGPARRRVAAPAMRRVRRPAAAAARAPAATPPTGTVAENEKIDEQDEALRIHARALSPSRVEARARRASGNRVEAARMIRVAAARRGAGEPRAAQRAVALDRLAARSRSSSDRSGNWLPSIGRSSVLVAAHSGEQQRLHARGASELAARRRARFGDGARPARRRLTRARHADDHVVARRAPDALRAHDFAQLRRNAVAVDRARRRLAADDVADAAAGLREPALR